jgi:hypothetical protein
MSQPALVFGTPPPRRPTPGELAMRDVCLCDSCCAAIPERAALREQRRRELRDRFRSIRRGQL